VEAHRRPDGTRELAFHVHNASEMPIYEVELPLPARADEEPGEEFIGLVPPGQTIRRPAPAGWRRSYTGPEPVQVEFLDVASHEAGRSLFRLALYTAARAGDPDLRAHVLVDVAAQHS
jgi:hypothetical protein